VTSLRESIRRLAEMMKVEQPEMPDAEFIAAPASAEQAAELLAAASAAGLSVLIWGGGTHQGLGGRVDPDLVVSTVNLNRVVAWEPDDLTLVIEAGAAVTGIEETLASKNQTALLPEQADGSTVGGVLAAGVSGFRRLRFGPTRDRVLEVTLVTGDGRVVRGGGRVVKNVTGYDLPRLAVGSLGAMGLIVSTCLKLWPLPPAALTVTIDDPGRAALVHRPLAVLSNRRETRVYLGGTAAEVEAQAKRLGGEAREGWHWLDRPAGRVQWSLRVPPALMGMAVERLPRLWAYVAQHGVGVITAGAIDLTGAVELRAWAESVGGSLVLAAAPDDAYQVIDPWGSPPAALDLQRRVIAGFDPRRVLNPGRLPGGI
jgi:glycolate oxidase FAD binding subunit